MSEFVKLIVVASILYFVFAPQSLNAVSVFNASDIMSSQKAGELSNHTISFRTFSGISGSGAIRLDFSNAVSSMGALNDTDIDLSYGSTTGMETLALLSPHTSSPLNFDKRGTWRVSVNRIAKTITLLFPTEGGTFIQPSDRIIIKIGTNATFQTVGDSQMANALEPASNIVIDIMAGSDDGKIAVVVLADNSIGVIASQPTQHITRNVTAFTTIPSTTLPPLSTPLVSSPGLIVPFPNEKQLEKFKPPPFSPPEKKIIVPTPVVNGFLSETQASNGKTKKPLRPDIEIRKTTDDFLQTKTSKKNDFPIIIPPQNKPVNESLVSPQEVRTLEPPSLNREDVKQSILKPTSLGAIPSVPGVSDIPVSFPVSDPIAPPVPIQPLASAPEQPSIIVELAAQATGIITPQQPEATVSVSNSDGSGLSISVSGTISSQQVKFLVQPLGTEQAIEWVPDISIPHADYDIVGDILYRVTAQEEGNVRANFNKPITMKLRYTDAQIAGMNEENIKAQYWDAVVSEWIVEPSSTVDTLNNTVSFKTKHLSFYSLRADIKNDTGIKRAAFKHISSKKIPAPVLSNISASDLYFINDTDKNIISAVDDTFEVPVSTPLIVCLLGAKIKLNTSAIILTAGSASEKLFFDKKRACYTASVNTSSLPGAYPLTVKIIYESDAVEIVRSQMLIKAPQQTLTNEAKARENTENLLKNWAIIITFIILAALFVFIICRRWRMAK